MRVLVTGGSGFLGGQIVASLRARGAEVTAPTRREADLLDPAARREVAGAGEVLVHAAWITRPGAYWQSPDNLEWVTASLDLARRFAASGGRRMVFVGTCAEYDWARPAGAGWAESRPCRPHTPYGAAKLLAWSGLQALAARRPLSVANARVFWPVGPGEHRDRLLPSLLRATFTGRPVAVGPAGLTRDFLDVRDAGAVIAAVALGGMEGAVNIGSGIPVTLGELAARVAGPGSPLIRLGARALPAGEPAEIVADARRLRRATGFRPRFALARTIADAAAHVREAALAA